MNRKSNAWAAALVLAAGLAVSVPAQDAGTAPLQNQNPVQNRAVRLSSVEGQVRITQAGGQLLTDQAVANTPLFDGFGIQAGDDGRAELQFPDGTIGRVVPDSSVSLAGLQQGAGDFVLDHGMAYFELRGAERVSFAGYIATASGSATIRVRLDDAPGEVAVFDGRIHLEGPGGLTADMRGGESVRLSPQGGALDVAELVEPDSWDAWNSDRDQALLAAAGSATPATRSMDDSANPAWGDLNQSGNWYDVPGQGYVWSPYQASDSSWDPYGSGYWMDTPSYGYTWISSENWGYLPYQCGLWNWYSGFGWGWAPGVCSPWWGGGVWIVNVGRGPVGWRPPIRPPRPRGPGNPRPGGGVHAVGPQPVIAVRREGPPLDGGLPLRDRRTPVTIAGATVTPLHPVAVRPVYNHQPAHTAMQYNGTGSGGSTAGSGTRPGYPTYTTPANGPAGASHARPAAGGVKSASAAPHAAPPPAPRVAAPPPPPPPHK